MIVHVRNIDIPIQYIGYYHLVCTGDIFNTLSRD